MAEKTEAATPTADPDRLEQYAFELYRDRSRTIRRGVEQLAAQCFTDAEAFLGIAARVRGGEKVAKKQETKLAEVHCPNQKVTHPLNLVSQHFAEKNGGLPTVLKRVRQINEILDRDPSLGVDNKGLDEAAGLPLDWDAPTVNVARAVFPAYCLSAN